MTISVIKTAINMGPAKESLQHGVFPGGHPSEY